MTIMASDKQRKPTTLREALDAIPGKIGRRGVPTWDHKLRLKNPALMAEIDELIDDFIDGKLDHKFSGSASVGHFLSPRLDGLSQDAIARYIERRRRKRSEQ